MKVVPITIRLATRLTKETHRREPSLTGALWAVGLQVYLADQKVVVGCAVVACPKARRLDSGKDEPKATLEVVRVAVPAGLTQNGHGGGCSMLYGACARAARDMGATNLFTYTHADEPGVSLRGAGWIREQEPDGTPIVFGGGQWGRAARPRRERAEDGPKHRWWAPWSAYLGFKREPDREPLGAWTT